MSAKGALPTPLPMDQRKRARELWESGESYGSIEAALGVNKSSLKSWRARDGWTREKSESTELVIAETVDDVPTDLADQQQEYEQNLRKAGVLFSRKVAAMQPEEVLQKADRVKQLDSVSRKALRVETEKPICAIQIGVLCAPVRRSKPDDGRLRPTHNPVELIEG
jgi:hypothetical protein